MRTHAPLPLRLTLALAVIALVPTTMLVTASAPRFFDDDPIGVERDTQDASGMQPEELNLFVELGRGLLSRPPAARGVRARNLNTIDEVPDSSWFTNRAGSRPLTPHAIAVGPNTSAGPAAGPWTVTASKSDGVTPGFTITDATGERWFLKFDAPGHPGMATGTEVAVTKLMWALGYHVPENHIAFLRPDQLVVGAGATFTPPAGKSRALRMSDIDALLRRVNRQDDGSYRVVASRSLPGTPIGRIRFQGTRPDDPNDIVPHEDRRELRGYGVFAAWLNHVDAKSINSLDMLITEAGGAFVRHYLVDFGSALGSGGLGPADFWAGAEYLIEPRQVRKRIVSFGFASSAWQRKPFYDSRAIGRLPLHNGDFDPGLWKPRVPNPAFLQARADDRFWAARKVVALDTELLRAAVRTGEFGDPAAEAFLVRALAERRDAIGRAYLTAINPVVDPALAGGSLTFRNAAVDADFARAPRGYRAIWATFDNTTGATRVIGETSGRTTRIAAPGGLPDGDGDFVKVEVSAVGADTPSWEVPVAAYFRLRGGQWRLVGFEHVPE